VVPPPARGRPAMGGAGLRGVGRQDALAALERLHMVDGRGPEAEPRRLREQDDSPESDAQPFRGRFQPGPDERRCREFPPGAGRLGWAAAVADFMMNRPWLLAWLNKKVKNHYLNKERINGRKEKGRR